MKIPRENIKSTGLSVVYEPENRTDVNLEYEVFSLRPLSVSTDSH